LFDSALRARDILKTASDTDSQVDKLNNEAAAPLLLARSRKQLADALLIQKSSARAQHLADLALVVPGCTVISLAEICTRIRKTGDPKATPRTVVSSTLTAAVSEYRHIFLRHNN